MDDPESWVRPHAWLHAQRRHSARIWHRDKALDPELRATLDALAGLTVAQRKALLLTQTSSITMAADGPRGRPHRRGRRAAAAGRDGAVRAAPRGALHGDPPATCRRLEQRTGDARFPRPSIIRRAGARPAPCPHHRRGARHGRRGAVGGTVVARRTAWPPRCATSTPRGSGRRPGAGPRPLRLRGPAGAASRWPQRSGDRTFRRAVTDDNTEGDGINIACQQERFADPDGLGALVRKFEASGQPAYTTLQALEQSAGDRAATTRLRAPPSAGTPAASTDRVQLLSSPASDRRRRRGDGCWCCAAGRRR